MNMDVGGIHFKSKCKLIRHINYTLIKILCEFIDNVIKKCDQINIQTRVNNSQIYEIKISDNYLNGFDNILKSKHENPFNMGFIREGHDDDNETSEFGIGMKAGAIACANKFTIYTKANDKYYRVEMDFVQMQNKNDIDESYNPTYFDEINISEYKKHHSFENGSTLILSEIRKEIYKTTNQENLTQFIEISLSEIYNNFISDVSITINSKKINKKKSFFEDNNSKIFNIESYIYILVKNNSEYLYYVLTKNQLNEYKYEIAEYNTDKHELCYLKKKFMNLSDSNTYLFNLLADKKEFKIFEQLGDNDKKSIQITSTFTYFSEKFDEEIAKDDDEIDNNLTPNNKLEIYKDKRKYCDKEISNRKNGRNNYNLHKMEFKSKKIGKLIGITFNKDIPLDSDYDLTELIKKIIHYHNKYLAADRTTIQFKKLFEYALKKNIAIPDYKKPLDKKNKLVKEDSIQQIYLDNINLKEKNETQENKKSNESKIIIEKESINEISSNVSKNDTILMNNSNDKITTITNTPNNEPKKEQSSIFDKLFPNKKDNLNKTNIDNNEKNLTKSNPSKPIEPELKINNIETKIFTDDKNNIKYTTKDTDKDISKDKDIAKDKAKDKDTDTDKDISKDKDIKAYKTVIIDTYTEIDEMIIKNEPKISYEIDFENSSGKNTNLKISCENNDELLEQLTKYLKKYNITSLKKI